MCALPLSKVLPQRKTNSLDAERENFERSQSISISKAINCQESPVKEKHVRSAIIGTFTDKGAGTFWGVVLKLPLQGNPIVAWKFCHVLHKVLREGHINAIRDSMKYQTSLKDLGKLWGLLKDGYGRLIHCYCTLLLSKLQFHLKNPRFPGNLSVTDNELDDIGERDVNVFFQMSCEFFDYMDEILALQAAVFGSLDMSQPNSMTNYGQCRLAPLIPCIQDSSQLYDYTVKVLFKLHAALPPDTLIGHRERFLQQFKKLQQFYLSASNLQYFKHLIHVPLLPKVMPRLFEGICPQFTQPVFNQCKSVGIKTVADFITQDPEILAKKLKTPFKDVLIIHRSLTVQFSGFTQSASSLFNDLLETISILDTGSKSLNRFLKGGVYTGEITEVHGPPGSGKTQLCLSVISNLIFESNSTVLYLDTSGNFTGKRLLLMLQKSNDKQDFTKKLQNVKIMQIYDIYDLFDSIESLDSELNKQESRFSRHLKLLVVDSVTPLLAPCFGSKFLDAVGLINNLSQQLNGLCSDHKLAVLVCNNTVQAKGSLVKPALGMAWKYVPSVSLSIEKCNSPVHKIKTVKSCRSDLSGSVTFKISEAGISD